MIEMRMVASYARDAELNHPFVSLLVSSRITDVFKNRATESFTARDTLISVIVLCLSKSVNLLIVRTKLSLIREMVAELTNERNWGRAWSLMDSDLVALDSLMLSCHSLRRLMNPMQTAIIEVVAMNDTVPLAILL